LQSTFSSFVCCKYFSIKKETDFFLLLKLRVRVWSSFLDKKGFLEVIFPYPLGRQRMSDFEEETYSTIFTSLKHPVRRKILRMLAHTPRNFSEMLETLGISSSHLTYHLENLGELISKAENGKYQLSTFGEAAIATMSKVEDVPNIETKRFLSLSLKWKSFFVALMIGFIVLAGVSYIQYQSLNLVSSEFEALQELIKLAETKQASLEFEHLLLLRLNKTEHVYEGSPYCFLYNPYDNSTLHLVLMTERLSQGHITITVQDASIFDPTTGEAGAVVWSASAAASNSYSVSLISKGWYTVSLVGKIVKMNNRTLVSMEVNEGVNCWMSLRITYEGTYSPFIVSPVYLF
jgi:DNA-binding transcriptional ArsR family regulator